MRLMADVRLELRGGGRTHGGMKVQAEGKQVVMDMRSPEERALAAAAEEEERREEQKMRPADCQRTREHKAAVRRDLEMLARDFPEHNISVDEVMGEWREVFGDDTVEKQLVDAALEDDVAELQRLLQVHPEAINTTYGDRSALMTAAYEGHLSSVCLLLHHGIDLELRSATGWTALHFAVASGRPLVVEVLLRAGAEVNVHDYYRDEVRKLEDMGVTPLHLARRWMERAGAPWHPLYDPRGGDSYWRIDQMLLAWGATEWLPTKDGRLGQSIRPALEDSDVDKDVHGVPLDDAEKEWLDPSWLHPDQVELRAMAEAGVDPTNTSYFAELEKQQKDADRSSSETETETSEYEEEEEAR
eukprot:CAMPEP_0177722412 /NCGR_PEP_ID=MMETSP0484_2-20121128/17666_1 /TAXON_ID=354590 /ORGANISM="Rhodomonas lens, Strain RHODO" /LENGTH=357 /DNA_ID=CAMNT_0019234781 /DNA_START=176 /DNA_END=1245 /DNA_ORIENTATION=+